MKPKDGTNEIRILKQELPYLRQHFGVDQVAIFGSYAKNNATISSDIDLVISLSRPLGFAFIELANYLEDKLGRRVDVITKTTLELGLQDPHKSHIAREIQNSLVYV